MIVRPQSNAVARSFSAAAGCYERYSPAQREAAGRLIDLLPELPEARSVLDAGCGTGMLLRLLCQRYDRAAVLGVDVAPGMIEACRVRCPDLGRVSLAVADIEQWEPEERFDLIASSFCFQWLRDRSRTLGRLFRMLSPDGVLAAAVPVRGSLPELAESYRAAVGCKVPGLDWAEPEEWLDAIGQTSVCPLRVEVEPVQGWFDSGLDVLRHFHSTGTTFRDQPGYRPASVPAMRRMAAFYERSFAVAGRVPVTYRVLYLTARRAEYCPGTKVRQAFQPDLRIGQAGKPDVREETERDEHDGR
jgi:malonyl-CoA O-methyltransferase